jgi:uncharacterized protein
MAVLTNQLGVETSPYLLQHSEQAVAWQGWNSHSLELAKREDKPIFLSIGYSSCHWCHMMAADSFDDPEVAAFLNQQFVSIKVDREERPDLDDIYQKAHQLLTGNAGGWPLTVFLCPHTQLPFIAGTYFPSQGGYGQIGFMDVLQRVTKFYREQHRDFRILREKVKQGYSQMQVFDPVDEKTLNLAPVNEATQHLLKLADKRYGGFGGAPKFPMAVNLHFLQQIYEQSGDPGVGTHLLLSLIKMAEGGIHDHIGGGFFRYTTDNHWEIPHFEKLLSDNALLLANYAEAWGVSGEPNFEQAAAGIFRWSWRALRHPQGAYYSAVDADSEGSEGGYYVWSENRLKALLEPREMELIQYVMGFDLPPNFTEHRHLNRVKNWRDAELELDASDDEVAALYHSAREKLLAYRLSQPSPNIDQKILCSWNALMVRGLAVAARTFNNQQYLDAAHQCIDFIRTNMWRKRRLLATWQQGGGKYSGYLDDYVYVMDALLESLQVQWRDQDYQFLVNLAEALLDNFHDAEQGGFFFTAHDHEALIYRSKPLIDSVLPCGNGIAAKVLLRLGYLAAEPRYIQAALSTLSYAWMGINSLPETHLSLLMALKEYFQPPVQVFLLGDEVVLWREALQEQFNSNVHCYAVPTSADLCPPEIMSMEFGQAVACVGDRCLEPQKHLADLMTQISEHLNI